MPQAQALAKPDFISERIEPSVRYVENKTLIFHSHALILHGQLNEARLTEVRLRLWDLQRRLLVNNQCHLLNIQIDNRKRKKIMFEEGGKLGSYGYNAIIVRLFFEYRIDYPMTHKRPRSVVY
jgi:hypothetical protein